MARMKRNLKGFTTSLASVAMLTLVFGAFAGTAGKYDPATTQCEMKYNLEGWSFAVKVQQGEGTIICDNGERADVDLSANAIGFTIGKSQIIGGEANFTPVKNLDDLFGQYIAAEAHAGATRSVEARVLTKGDVSLALGGSGNGIDVGAAIGAFTIAKQ